MQKVRDEATKQSFINYLMLNPHLRFWQALTNWSGFSHVYYKGRNNEMVDVYYLEDTHAD